MDPTNRRISDVESLYESLRGALWLHSDLGARLQEAREEPVTAFKVTVFPHPYLVIARPVRFDVRMPLSYPGAPPVIQCETPEVLQADQLTMELPPVRTPRDRRSSSVGRSRPSSAQSGPRSARSNSGGHSGDRIRPRTLLDAEHRPTLSMLRTDAGFYGWTRAYSLPDAIFGLALALLVPNQPRPQWIRPEGRLLRPEPRQTRFRCLSGTEERQGPRPTMEDRSASFPDFSSSLGEILGGYGGRASSMSRERPSSRSSRGGYPPAVSSPAASPAAGASARWMGKTASLFVVFDGHGGPGASEYAADWLPRFLAARLRDAGDPLWALWRAFQDTDAHFLATTEKRAPPASPVLWRPVSRGSAADSPARRRSSGVGLGAKKHVSSGDKAIGGNDGSDDEEEDEDAFVIPGVGSRATGRPGVLPTAETSGRNVRQWYANQVQRQASHSREEKRGGEIAMEDDRAGDDEDDDDEEDSPVSLARRRGNRRNLFVQTTDLPDKSGCTAVAALIVDASAEALYCAAAPLVAHPNVRVSRDATTPSAAAEMPTYNVERQSGFLLVVGNVGDSRAVMSRAGVATVLTNDQKASRADERARVVSSGGLIIQNRVMGRLAITRAIGDRELKEGHHGMHIITAEPELTTTWLAEDDEFLLLACDGLFDVLSSEDAIALARYHLSRGVGPREVAGILADCALERSSNDNVTVQVVLLGDGVPRGCVPKRPQLGPPPQSQRGNRGSSRSLLNALRDAASKDGEEDCEDEDEDEAEGIGHLARVTGVSKTMPTPLPSTRASAKKSMWGGFGDDEDDEEEEDEHGKGKNRGPKAGSERSPQLGTKGSSASSAQQSSSSSPPGRPTLRDMQKRKGDNPFSRSSRRKFRPLAAEKSPSDDASPGGGTATTKSPEAPPTTTTATSRPSVSPDALDTALHSSPPAEGTGVSPLQSPPQSISPQARRNAGGFPSTTATVSASQRQTPNNASHGLAALGSIAVADWSTRASGGAADRSQRRRSSGHQLERFNREVPAITGEAGTSGLGSRQRRSSVGSPVRVAERQVPAGGATGSAGSGGGGGRRERGERGADASIDGLLSDLLQRTGDAFVDSPQPRRRERLQRRENEGTIRQSALAEPQSATQQDVQEEDLMNFLMDPRNFDEE